MELVSNIKFPTKRLVEIVQFVSPPIHRMPKEWTLEFSNAAFEFKGNSNIRIFDPEIDWDGTAYCPPYNLAVVAATDKFLDTGLPMVWWPNEELKGLYIRGTYLKTAEEFLLYCAAHEVRHIEQWENPKMRLLGKNFAKADDETDADLYAILKLTQWRNKKCK